MSALPSRRDAEDIANGTTLGGNSELVDRVLFALRKERHKGLDDGFSKGYERAIVDMQDSLQELTKA